MSKDIEIRRGAWWDVLEDVPYGDALITDPPYSLRTHVGQRTGSSVCRATVCYNAMSVDDAENIAHFWNKRIRKWAVIFCDHVAFEWHETAWQRCGWATFAPVVWVKPDATPRLTGDGPQCSIEMMMIARRRGDWAIGSGSRKGYYMCSTAETRGCGVAGAKPLTLMQAIIRDYTDPGDLVIDPYAGSGTTLVAADTEGRRAIGSELDAVTFGVAATRLARGYTPCLFRE